MSRSLFTEETLADRLSTVQTIDNSTIPITIFTRRVYCNKVSSSTFVFLLTKILSDSKDSMMGRTCVLVILAVCVFWTFGETLSCDQCGRECMPSCGTRQFRACCYNNMKKRNQDSGFKLWLLPVKESEQLQLNYNP
ncbi:uncharacterized protein Trissin [Venturia canescens]|uniref:uncharacterized protein Trissin n=1 Tax=Venturia canescens TaxID=32260 RepID=UPI001C9D42CA|nr:uncharacterized protein LOC122407933 [Venturia canescens]